MNQWAFVVSQEHLKLVNMANGETFFFIKRHVSFYPVDGTDELVINGHGMNMKKKIKRAECVTPAPGVDMMTFLDSLATLASA